MDNVSLAIPIHIAERTRIVILAAPAPGRSARTKVRQHELAAPRFPPILSETQELQTSTSMHVRTASAREAETGRVTMSERCQLELEISELAVQGRERDETPASPKPTMYSLG